MPRRRQLAIVVTSREPVRAPRSRFERLVRPLPGDAESCHPRRAPVAALGASMVVVTAGIFGAVLLLLLALHGLQRFDGLESLYVVSAVAAVIGLAGLVAWKTRSPKVPAVVSAALGLIAAFVALAVGAALLQWQFNATHTYVTIYPLMGPAVVGAACVAAVIIGLAALVVPRRVETPRWLLTLSVFALAGFVGLGLWIPAYLATISVGRIDSDAQTLAALAPYAVGCVVPPAVTAAVAALVVVRWPQMAARRRVRAVLGAAIVILILYAAFAAQLNERLVPTRAMYGQFAPLIVGAGFVALSAVVSLAISDLRRTRRLAARRRREPVATGTVVAPVAGGAVHELAMRGWLVGYRPLGCPFAVRIGRDEIELPASVAVAAPLPPSLASCPPGETIPLLVDGDPIEIVGLDAAGGEAAYRSSTRPRLGTGGVVIFAKRSVEQSWGRDVALRMWPPCVAILLACALVAAPAVLVR